ncbi:MAG: carboxypeptidase regulatory-like domain-containing protein [Proteobacteria bacterium]|nr:carboxypeptidase regulatory-like domain-containing protein [Pseudomonadota bacterium]
MFFSNRLQFSIFMGFLFLVSCFFSQLSCKKDTTGQTETVDDSETSDSTDSETFNQLPSKPTEDSPVQDHVAAPSGLYVRVQDNNGIPLSGAVVSLAGLSGTTDEFGDVGFNRLVPDRYAISITKTGHCNKIDVVELKTKEIVRLEYILHERSEPVVIPAAAGGVATHNDYGITLPSNGLIDMLGKPYEGSAAVTITGFDTSDKALASLPAPLIAITKDEKYVGLETVGAFDAEILDDQGHPLSLAEGKTAEVVRKLPDGVSLEVGTNIPMWTADRTQGIWVEEPGVEATVEQQEGNLVAKADLPHLSTWNFDMQTDVACFWLEVDLPPEYDGNMLELSVQASWRTKRKSLGSEREFEIVNITPGSVTARLLLRGEEIGKVSFNAGQVSSYEPWTACPKKESNTYKLSSTITPTSVGSGQGKLKVVVSSGYCPAPGLLVRISSGDKRPVFDKTIPGSILYVDGLSAGQWTIEVFDPKDANNAPLTTKQIDVDLSDCSNDECSRIKIPIDVPIAFAHRPPGGCVPLPCEGSECNSCLLANVYDESGSPLGNHYVSLFDPVNTAYATDENGTICADIDQEADIELLAVPDDGFPTSVVLPRSARCEEQNCAVASFWVNTETIPCASEQFLVRGAARRMGFRDPAFTTDGEYPIPDVGYSVFRANVLHGDNDVTQSLDTEVLVKKTYGFVRRLQGLSGATSQGNTVVRTKQTSLGLSFEFATKDHPLTFGEHAVGSSEGQIEVALTVDWFPATKSAYHYKAESGSLKISDGGSSQTSIEFNLELIPIDETPGTGFGLTGNMVFHFYTQADTPKVFSSQLSHPINGARFQVLVDGASSSFGPSGQFAEQEDVPTGEIQYCISKEGWHMMVGDDIPGMARPFTALQEVKNGSLTLFGNDSANAKNFVTTSMRWFAKDFLEFYYKANDVEYDAESATIVGVAMRAPEMNGIGFNRIYLESPSGEIIEGCHKNDAFECAEDKTITSFLFLNVPPRPIESPYTLHLVDEDGNEVGEYTQKIAPVSGGVMITHN